MWTCFPWILLFKQMFTCLIESTLVIVACFFVGLQGGGGGGGGAEILLLKYRVCSSWSKFFPFRVESFLEDCVIQRSKQDINKYCFPF